MHYIVTSLERDHYSVTDMEGIEQVSGDHI